MKDSWVRDVKEKDLSKYGEGAWRNAIIKELKLEEKEETRIQGT